MLQAEWKPALPAKRFVLPVLLGMALAGFPSPALSGENLAAQSVGETGIFETRGLVRSRMRVEYRSELVAPVLATPVLAGQSFVQGDLLVSFNCVRHSAQAEAAMAAARAAAVEYKTKTRLLKRGAAGKDETVFAEAAFAKARAEAEAAQAVIAGCELRAPFAGRVVEMNARPLELPPSDKPLIVFLDNGQLELEMVVPSNWLGWLAGGMALEFVVDETGQTHQARISRIGAEVDAVSQTVRVTAQVEGNPAKLLPGMSGFARFSGQG